MQVEAHWKGKPLSQMTKDELIKALEQLGEMHWLQEETRRHDLDVDLRILLRP